MGATHAWCCTEIKEDLALFQKAIFSVELDELEGCSGPISLFLRELVPLIETAFAMLCIVRHRILVNSTYLFLDTHPVDTMCSRMTVICCLSCQIVMMPPNLFILAVLGGTYLRGFFCSNAS